jgi:DHA3 family macrolide efflux protein-like MFS transporter
MTTNWKKNTALFLSGQALSIFGSMVVQYAIMWHIILKTQSGSMMSLFSVVGFLPMFLISPFAGIWADRFNRKYLINISDGAIALASLVVALILLFGHEHIGILFLCAVVRSFGQGVQTPAVGAFIPQIVPPEHLTKINGIQTSIQSLCMFASPMISAALMTFAPLAVLFFLDVVTAGIGIAILFFFVKAPKAVSAGIGSAAIESAAAEDRKGIDYFRDLKEGLRYVRQHGYIFRLVILTAVFSFFAAPTAFLTPLQIARNFGPEVWRLSSIEITFSLGMMLGGLLIGVWGGFKNRVYTMALAAFVFGLEAIGLGLVRNFWIYIAIMGIAGLTMPFYNTPSMVLLQSKVAEDFMGRIIAVFGMVGSVMMPIGMMVFGPLGDMVPIDLLLIGTGIVLTLLGIPFLTSRELREAGK